MVADVPVGSFQLLFEGYFPKGKSPGIHPNSYCFGAEFFFGNSVDIRLVPAGGALMPGAVLERQDAPRIEERGVDLGLRAVTGKGLRRWPLRA
jgi:hypothetical protein